MTSSEVLDGPIEVKEQSDIRQTPYSMPKGFVWSNVDVTDDAQLSELYNLLSNNYVEDDDALFRFDYSKEFLLWALNPPHALPEYCFGVRSEKNGNLLAFISGIPAKLGIYSSKVDIVEINFLCVHKKLRSKRLAPVLIKEITRRVNLNGVFQAVYTAGTVLPGSVASCRYYHRNLNPKKLVNVGFTKLAQRMTIAKLQKHYKLPTNPHHDVRAMTEADVPRVHELLTNYLEQFAFKICFTPAEVAHWLLPRKNVVDCFVLENAQGQVTDVMSFYHLPSSILNHNDTLYAAYSFYNVATTLSQTELMRDCLILSKQCNSDVFNALDLMENRTFLEELKFGMGDGKLQYYIYNWSCQPLESRNVGIVLL